MGAENLIEGHVAGILNKREIVINRGSDDGVEIGMRFAILHPVGTKIYDPISKEEIGEIPIAKTLVKVVRVNGPRVSVARTFRTISAVPGLSNLIFAAQPARPETFEFDSADRLDSEGDDSLVRVGDPVRETEGDEFDDM